MPKLSLRTKLIITCLIISAAFYLVNIFTHQYRASSYINVNGFLVIFPAALLYIFSNNIKQSHLFIAFILQALWLIVLISLVTNIFTITIQYTPFKLHDALLHQWDSYLGFNIISFINWTHQFPNVIHLLQIAYTTTIKQIFIATILLAFLQQQRRFEVFLNVCLISTIIGYLIYYFMPSSAPAHIFHSPYFTEKMISVAQRFYDVQHHIPNNNLSGGIIAFPSFHTIWVLTVAYSFKNYKIIFYPLILWNSLIILATLALGWHFLTDVIASVFIFIFAVIIAEKKATLKDFTFKEMIAGYRSELS